MWASTPTGSDEGFPQNIIGQGGPPVLSGDGMRFAAITEIRKNIMNVTKK